MSFFCPHFEAATDLCAKVRCECIPGRPGCVLRGKVTFAVPAAERVASRTRPGARKAGRSPGAAG